MGLNDSMEILEKVAAIEHPLARVSIWFAHIHDIPEARWTHPGRDRRLE